MQKYAQLAISQSLQLGDKELNNIPGYYFIKQQRFVCLHPGSKNSKKRWDSTNFAFLADALITLGFQVVLTGCKDEKVLIQKIMIHMQHKALDLSGRLSLHQTAALISKSKLLISNCTRIISLAEALVVPTLVISVSDEKHWTSFNQTIHQIISKEMMFHPSYVLAETIKFLQRIDFVRQTKTFQTLRERDCCLVSL